MSFKTKQVKKMVTMLVCDYCDKEIDRERPDVADSNQYSLSLKMMSVESKSGNTSIDLHSSCIIKMYRKEKGIAF